jgi:hypothetical protein
MTTSQITLVDYEKAERVIAREEARTALTMHAAVSVVISVLLVVLNATVADGSPGQHSRSAAWHSGWPGTGSATSVSTPTS